MSGLFDRLQDEIEVRDSGQGLSPIDLLDMPETLVAVINQIVRKNGMTLDQIAKSLDQPTADTKLLLNDLVEKGYVRQVQVRNDVWYKAYFGRKADKNLSLGIWNSLGDLTDLS